MKFSDWASMFSLIVGANIGTTNILKKDNKCGILNYINSLGQKGYTLDVDSPNTGGEESNDGKKNFGFF